MGLPVNQGNISAQNIMQKQLMARNNSNITIADGMPYNSTQAMSLGNRENSNERQTKGSPKNDYSTSSYQSEKPKSLKGFTERSKSDAPTNKI